MLPKILFRKINDVYGVILTVEAKDTNDVETLFGQFADLQQLVEQWGKASTTACRGLFVAANRIRRTTMGYIKSGR